MRQSSSWSGRGSPSRHAHSLATFSEAQGGLRHDAEESGTVRANGRSGGMEGVCDQAAGGGGSRRCSADRNRHGVLHRAVVGSVNGKASGRWTWGRDPCNGDEVEGGESVNANANGSVQGVRRARP